MLALALNRSAGRFPGRFYVGLRGLAPGVVAMESAEAVRARLGTVSAVAVGPGDVTLARCRRSLRSRTDGRPRRWLRLGGGSGKHRTSGVSAAVRQIDAQSCTPSPPSLSRFRP